MQVEAPPYLCRMPGYRRCDHWRTMMGEGAHAG